MIKINDVSLSDEMPLIAIKNTVLFPRIIVPLVIQRPKSVAALEYAMSRDNYVFFVAQRNLKDDTTVDDLYRVGTLGRIITSTRTPEGYKVDVEGIARVELQNFTQHEPFFKARGEMPNLRYTPDVESEALIRNILDVFKRVSETRIVPSVLSPLLFTINQSRDPSHLIDLLAVNLNLDYREQQELLEVFDVNEALRRVNLHLAREWEILQTEEKVAKETKKQLGKMQKEVFLREQLKSIEKELGVDGEKGEFDQLRKKLKQAKMPEEVEKKALKELERLERMPMFNPEISYLRTYLDWLVELPWSLKSENNIDLKKADRVLEAEHHGLSKVKERVLEHLAVQKRVGKIRGPILCFFGPPGTGKTSIGRSIASALGRKFVRISLGGLHDEAEIRGHRRTYVGALPGRIIQGIHTAGSRNPVFMLDEIDKIGQDFRGDPSAALLEALDPEQNHAFSDNYLEVPFDLSDVLFVTTANRLDTIPHALRDRLEIIEFSGYTDDEKISIARKFLIPKITKQHGLKPGAVIINDPVLRDVVSQHTHEAGARELERKLATIFRKIVRQLVEKKSNAKVKLTDELVHKYLGPARYTHQQMEKKDEIGVATGLVWTPVGGEILAIEATKMDGRGRLVLTGYLGNVMRESIHAAMSYIRANAKSLGINTDFYKEDVHVHVPSGGIPKDGPSAGVGMATAIVSLFTKRAVRKDVGMTGEITLRGKVLPIGGIKEKLIAAHRAGLKTVVVPEENKKDLEEIPAKIRKEMKLVFAKTMDDVLKVALQ